MRPPGAPSKIDQLLVQAVRAHQAGDLEAAVKAYDRVLALDRRHVQALGNRGAALWVLGRAAEALASCDRALALDSRDAMAHGNRGNALRDLGRSEEALESYDRALSIRPGEPVSLLNRANALRDLGRFEEALASLDRALVIRPALVQAHNNRGNVLRDLKRPLEALAAFDRAITLQPDLADAHSNRGAALSDLERAEDALASCDRAIALNPEQVNAHINRGAALKDLDRPDEALAAFDQALALSPKYDEAHYNRGAVLFVLERFDDALTSFDKAIALNPKHAEAFLGRGNVLNALDRTEDALADFDQSLALDPTNPQAHANRAKVLSEVERLDEALVSFDKVIELDPEYRTALGQHAFMKRMRCDWSTIDEARAQLALRIRVGEIASEPFAMLSSHDDPALHRLCADICMAEMVPASAVPPPRAAPPRREKIRVGYFSADFRFHPVMMLAAETFERHERSRFEVSAFSFGPKADDAWRKRAEGAFDTFHDLRENSSREIVELARAAGLDIAVDLLGLTQHFRPGIFAGRAAPIQASWLGYPGTMGGVHYDYVVADPFVIPPSEREHFSEKVAYLPDTYQANCHDREVDDTVLRRENFGLPAVGTVYCSFNNPYKILPESFDVWMGILKRVPDAVLWLLVQSGTVQENLRREAAARGVDPARLVYTNNIAVHHHLNRLRLADVFLDTLPYNAHTTASDALRMGVPVVTCPGRSFAARVAGSLVRAAGMPELVTESLTDYEELAVALGTDPARLAATKAKLLANVPTCALFDSERFTRNLEGLYERMVARAQAGLPPDHLEPEPV